MKKALSILLTLVILLLAPPFALAGEPVPEENSGEEPAADVKAAEEAAALPAELFDLWDYGGESPVWVSTAVPISEGILLAPVSVKDIPPEQLAVTDGVNAWEAVTVISSENDRFALVFYEPGDKPARYGSWELLPWGASVPASACTVRFGDSLGSRINRGVLAAENITWQGDRFMLLTLTDPAPAGSPVLTSDGRLAGVITAEWAQGENRVLMLPVEVMAGNMSEVAGLLRELPEWGAAPQGLVVTAEKNLVTINWKDMTMPEVPEGSAAYMVIVDTGNDYLTSFPMKDVEGSEVTLLLTPGRFYIVGPVVSQGRPDVVPSSYASVFLTRAERLTEYNFRPVVTAIAEITGSIPKDGAKPVPVAPEEVTEALLRSDRAYFYSHSTYDVTEEIDGKSLLVTLTDPNGNNYRYESSWLYSPAYMREDIWYLSLNDMGLTASLNQNGYPAGVYKVAFYVDGDLADEFTFELK